VKKFQTSIGKDSTGQLNFEEAAMLMLTASKINFETIYPIGNLKTNRSNQIISAQGTWVIEGERIAEPINIAVITCRKNEGICYQSDARITKSLFAVDNQYLDLQYGTYKITSWNDEEVLAEDESLCRTTVLNINTTTKQVFQIIRNNTALNCEKLFNFPLLNKPRIAQLVDGFKVAQEFYEQKNKERLKLINPEFRQVVEDLFQKSK